MKRFGAELIVLNLPSGSTHEQVEVSYLLHDHVHDALVYGHGRV